MTSDLEKMKKFVKLGFNDCSVDFRIREVNEKDIIEIVKLIKDYNEFNGEKVAKAIAKINKIWNNSYQLSYAFGREGSCVLYINLPYWKLGKDDYTIAERKAKIDTTLEILQQAKADELSLLDNDTIRAWWD
jgi:hypothetical protein